VAISNFSKTSVLYFLSISSFSLFIFLGNIQISKSIISFDLEEKAYAGWKENLIKTIGGSILKNLGKGIGAGAVGAMLTPQAAAQSPQLRYLGKSCIGSNGFNNLPYFYGSDGAWYANISGRFIQVPAPSRGAYCNFEWYSDQNGYRFYKPI
jgi:hypothetical protein